MTGEGAWRVALTGPVAGDAAEFIRLIRGELPGAYRLAGYLLGDATEAEDATQEALEKAWHAWPKLRERDRAGAWFDRIVANACKDRLRERRGIRVLELDDEAAGAASARDPFREALSRDEVGRLVRNLPPDQLMVVALRYWRDLSLEEIAERLELPLGTVKSRLHYAMKALRRQLGRQGGEVSR
ncbi:MAG: sigma-70 family RNA polymerase sigma factor [Candidatus Limnocylindrales bacterium]